MWVEDLERTSPRRDRTRLLVVIRCAHCGTTVDDDLLLVPPHVRRLQDHLLGCPAALNACHPALPIFRDGNELRRHFIVEERKPP